MCLTLPEAGADNSSPSSQLSQQHPARSRFILSLVFRGLSALDISFLLLIYSLRDTLIIIFGQSFTLATIFCSQLQLFITAIGFNYILLLQA